MQRFNKVLKKLGEELLEKKNVQYSYRTFKYQKLIGILMLSTVGITFCAFYRLGSNLDKQKKENQDDSNNEDVLNEARALLKHKLLQEK